MKGTMVDLSFVRFFWRDHSPSTRTVPTIKEEQSNKASQHSLYPSPIIKTLNTYVIPFEKVDCFIFQKQNKIESFMKAVQTIYETCTKDMIHLRSFASRDAVTYLSSGIEPL